MKLIKYPEMGIDGRANCFQFGIQVETDNGESLWRV